MDMTRRQFLATLLAGGAVIAGELWVPGQKLISIPSKKVFVPPVEIDTLETIMATYSHGAAIFKLKLRDVLANQIPVPLVGFNGHKLEIESPVTCEWITPQEFYISCHGV